MIILHAIWTHARLHLWGEDCAPRRAELESPEVGGEVSPTGDGAGVADGGSASSRMHPMAVAEDALRGVVGDVFDSLLVSGAASSSLALRLPCRDGRPVPSRDTSAPVDESSQTPALSLEPLRVPTLVFAPADAVDLLTASPLLARDGVQCGASMNYWSRVAGLVLELLAGQRFVPAVHHAGGEQYRGYWRVVVDEEETSRRLSALIVSMPPVCRSPADGGESLQASVLVENFLWVTVDALVRRCLEGDELAHTIHDQPDERCLPQMWWLRSLVRGQAVLAAPTEQRHSIFETVSGWISKLEPSVAGPTCRTCFRLHAPTAPEATAETSPSDSEGAWRLTLHVQATQDPRLVVDAVRLMSQRVGDPLILKRPFDSARVQLRADVAQAARHFPPLIPCAEPSGPLECTLTLDEAYSFLRNAAPLLESDGFGVWVPRWWREEGPRLRMRLDVRPTDGDASVASSKLGLDAIVSFDWRLAVGDDELSPEEISHLAMLGEPLVRLRGRWIEIQPSDIQAALRFLNQSRGDRMTLFEAMRQCYLADDLDTGLPVAGLRAHGWIEHFLNAGECYEELEHLSPPKGFIGTLRPYQLRGVEWLSFLTKLGLGACLADDMGLGKTIQLIAQLLSERETGTSPGPTLLVVPMSLVGNWQREIERF